MIPIIKALSLIGKVFSQPIVILFKVSIQKIGGTPRETLVRWGNIIYNWEAWINRRFLGYEGKVKEVILNEEKALETFANFFIEVIVIYGILGYYTISSGIEKHKENAAEKEKKDRLEDEVIQLSKQNNEMRKELEILKSKWESQQEMWNAVIQGQNGLFEKTLQSSIENAYNISKMNEKLFQIDSVLNRKQ